MTFQHIDRLLYPAAWAGHVLRAKEAGYPIAPSTEEIARVLAGTNEEDKPDDRQGRFVHRRAVA